MSAPLSSAVLKARLDVALGLFELGGLELFFRWIKAANLTGREAELLLIEAILQVASVDDEFTGASAVLAHAFHDRLLEARDGLI